MKEIPRAKKLEVAQSYILGCPYSDIENRSGVSHGSVANIVRELEYGRLIIPGTSFHQVNDLRQLSLELKKRDLQPSQAVLGLLLFDRLQVLEITPELVDKWSELAKRLLPVDFPATEFLEAALRLNELERSEGKPFGTLAEEYMRLKEGVDELNGQTDSLVENRQKLVESAKSQRSEVESLERTKGKLENTVEIQTGKLSELKSKTEETQKEGSRLRKETEDLQRRKRRLSSEVGSREELLRRLNDIGLSEEDLLRITAFIDRTSKNEGIGGNELKKKFLSALDLFGHIAGLENRRKAETQQLSELTRKEAILSAEITELSKRKSLLEGEIAGVISSTSQEVKAVGEDATSQIRQQVADIRNQLNTLLADALKAGEAIGEMRQVLKRGEESESSLGNFIKEVQSSLGRN